MPAPLHRSDARLAEILRALIADRYDAQARIPAGRHGGGQFTSSGGGGGGPSKSQERRAAVRSFTNAAVERAIKSGATHKQVSAIREIEHRAHAKVQRASARLAQGTQQTLFSKAPKQPGSYRLSKAVGGGTAVGIANKALVHAAAQKGLAEHAARVARKTTPPPAAAPHATTAAAASLRPSKAPAAGGKTAAHSEAEQRLARAQAELKKINDTGYGAANRRYVEQDIARARNEVQDHERKSTPSKPERPLGGVSNYDLEATQNQHISTLTQMSHDVSVRARRAGLSAADFERDIADPSHPQHELHKRFQSAKENVRSHVAETEHRRETRERETEAKAARESSERAAGLTERKYARPVERALTKGERDTNKQIDQHDREVERLASSMDKLKDPARRREVNAQIDRVNRERERLELTLTPGVRNAHEAKQSAALRAKLAKAAEKRQAKNA